MNIKKVGVVGGGTMGQGIAEMLAGNGIDVLLVEKTAEKLKRAMAMIENSLNRQIEKWALTNAEKKLIMTRIHPVDWVEQLSVCDMVIESIDENLEEKKQVFRKLDSVCSPEAILASNTSTLSITELASASARPERVIGMHFLYPVAKNDIVEIVRGLKTSDETFSLARAFVETAINKKAIQVYESPGYVTSRLILVLINEALLTLSEGVASAEDIDSAMRIGYDFRYGPLEMADRFGLDSVYEAMQLLFREFGDVKYRPSFLLRQMVRAGKLGVKTGEGFFRYDKDGVRL